MFASTENIFNSGRDRCELNKTECLSFKILHEVIIVDIDDLGSFAGRRAFVVEFALNFDRHNDRRDGLDVAVVPVDVGHQSLVLHFVLE